MAAPLTPVTLNPPDWGGPAERAPAAVAPIAAAPAPAPDARGRGAGAGLRTAALCATAGTWTCAEVTTVWWALQSYALGNAMNAGPTGVAQAAYAGVPFVTGWLVLAFFAQLLLVIALGASLDPGRGGPAQARACLVVTQTCAYTAMTGVLVAYAWSVATYDTFQPVYHAYYVYMDSLAMQTISAASNLVLISLCLSWQMVLSSRDHDKTE